MSALPKEKMAENIQAAKDGAASTKPKDEVNDVPYELEYGAQYYKFHPNGFVDSMYNKMFHAMNASLKKLEGELMENHSNAISKEEFKEIKKDIRKSMVGWMNGKFHALQPYVTNELLAIPPFVLLPEDAAQEDERLKLVAQDDLDKEIRELERQVATMSHMRNQIDKEKEIIKTVREKQNAQKERMQEALEIIKNLDAKCDGDEKKIRDIIDEKKDQK